MKNLFLLLPFLILCWKTFSQTEPRLVLPVGHNGYITDLIFSEDNKYIFTQASDHTIRIWDAATGASLQEIRGFDFFAKLRFFQEKYVTDKGSGRISITNQELSCFDFAPKRQQLITSFGDNSIQLRNLENTKIEKIFEGHDLPITHVVFSPDETKMASASLDKSIIVWDIESGKKLAILTGHLNWINSVVFNHDGSQLLSAANDGSVILWDIKSQVQIKNYESAPQFFAKFSKNEKYIYASSLTGKYVSVWNLKLEKIAFDYYNSRGFMVEISPDEKYLILWNFEEINVFNLESGNLIQKLDGGNACFNAEASLILYSNNSRDSLCFYDLNTKKITKQKVPCIIEKIQFSSDPSIVALQANNGIFMWDLIEKKVKFSFGRGKSNPIYLTNYSKDNIINQISLGFAKYNGEYPPKKMISWDTKTGKFLEEFNFMNDDFNKVTNDILSFHTNDSVYYYSAISNSFIQKFKQIKDSSDNSIFNYVEFSPDKKWLATHNDSLIRIWNVYNGLCVDTFFHQFASFKFSPNNKFFIIDKDSSTLTIDLISGKVIQKIITSNNYRSSTEFLNNESFLYYSSDREFDFDKTQSVLKSNIYIWDYLKGNLIVRLENQMDLVSKRDLNYIFTSGIDSTINQWDLSTGICLKTLKCNSQIKKIYMNPYKDEVYWIDSKENDFYRWDFKTESTYQKYEGHSSEINEVIFDPNGEFVLSTANDFKTIIWDRLKSKSLYTRIQLENNDWLVYDEHYRFDGTPGAIEKLYFVCGLEVVELNQIKDSLYVPNLVQRIMNGESLDHLPKLSELNICGVTPVVEPLENDKSGNQGYRIIPRSGGVGDVDVYINGVVRLSTNAKKLKRKESNYMLYVDKELLELYQIPGEETKVKVIAKTANNSISSRGVVIDIESDEKTTFKKPALHAIMIGVDDYKGDGLDLNYAAKDANDLQIVLQKSAQKFFNIDDTSRVHFYNLTVNRSGANGNEKIKGITPDSANIVKTINIIEKTSKPEDILLLFFAGHGEIVDKDQLLLLTSESSRDDFKGLRMRELLELLNKVPAGKRVLILDACHSGAAINNMDMAQLTGKRDVKDAERQSQRLKELDKLASKSGFAIITASSSDQKALELPQYEHGLMTYALLNSMLNNKNALDEDNKLQLEKWLMATEEEVRKLNANQSAERMVPINFTLGKVDDEVRSSIVLKEIPLVYVKNVINTDLAYDNLEIESKLNEYFANRARGGDKSLLLASVDQTNATLVNILYTKEKNAVNLKITILKNNQVHKQFSKAGAEAQLNDLIKEIALDIEAGVK
jgi:WD40 repeat protein